MTTTKEIAEGNDKTRESSQDMSLDVLSTGFSLECKCKTALSHHARLRNTTVVMNPGLHIFPLEESGEQIFNSMVITEELILF